MESRDADTLNGVDPGARPEESFDGIATGLLIASTKEQGNGAKKRCPRRETGSEGEKSAGKATRIKTTTKQKKKHRGGGRREPFPAIRDFPVHRWHRGTSKSPSHPNSRIAYALQFRADIGNELNCCASSTRDNATWTRYSRGFIDSEREAKNSNKCRISVR